MTNWSDVWWGVGRQGGWTASQAAFTQGASHRHRPLPELQPQSQGGRTHGRGAELAGLGGLLTDAPPAPRPLRELQPEPGR